MGATAHPSPNCSPQYPSKGRRILGIGGAGSNYNSVSLHKGVDWVYSVVENFLLYDFNL